MEAFFTPFIFGLLSTASPCVLPLYPGFLAYLSGTQNQETYNTSRYFLGLFVLLGVLSMMLLLGALIAGLSVAIGRVLVWFIPIADLAIIVLGILLIANINPFKSLPQVQSPLLKHPFLNAYFYGLLYGPLTLPCSGPLVVGIFAYSFTIQEVASKLVVFLGFGLGFGLPLLILSFLSGALQRGLVRFFARHSRVINLVGGFILVGVGLYDLSSNWDMIQIFLG
jgi:cytochrome c-type biogenesis protein